MKTISSLLALFALTSLSALAQATGSEAKPPLTTVVHIDQEKIAAAFAKGSPILVTNNFKIQAGHRVAPGNVEIHTVDTDIFYITAGTAMFITGGKATETTNSSPTEIRGKTIVGGEARHLVKGDVIVIPNGVPHWFTEVSNPFEYFVVKVSK